MITGSFVGLDSATLATMKTEWLACLTAIAANQSYSTSGSSFTRADLQSVRDIIAEIQFAIDSQTGGTLQRITYAQMDT